ncbi:MAG: class II glutamine amidotransferase [Bacteriovoracaceae bacterium]
MCRLFGFRSIIEGQVHKSLVEADNALEVQSIKHPDGWGVAYYREGSPHIIKSTDMAKNSALFKKVSGVVSSKTVLAHIRKSTIGENNILNTHPFQYGPWVFAHNGNIKNFEDHREKIKETITPELRQFILGQTDSELIFFFLLSYLTQNKGNSVSTGVPLLRKAITDLTKMIGDYSVIDEGNTENFLTFILSNGKSVYSHQGGKKLFYSTHKSKCSESSTCANYAPECEKEIPSGKVSHLIISSEPTLSENVWSEFQVGEIIAAGEDMIVHKDRL